MYCPKSYGIKKKQQLFEKVEYQLGKSGLQDHCFSSSCRQAEVSLQPHHDELKSLCNHINSSSSNSEAPARRAVGVELDVTADGGNIEAAVQIAWDAFGRIDALVNNAGVQGLSTIFVKL